MKINKYLNFSYTNSLFWAILLFYSSWFFLPRVLQMDNAFIMYNLIENQSFFIAHNRFSMALLQFVALVAIKLNLSINTVLVLSSVAPMLINALIAWLLFSKLKNKYLAALWLLINIYAIPNFIVFAFADALSAVGIALLIVGVFLKYYLKFSIVHLVLLNVLLLLLVFLHPSALILIAIVNLFIIQEIRHKSIFILILSSVFSGLLYFIVKPKGGYDTHFLDNLMNSFSFEYLKSSFYWYYLKTTFYVNYLAFTLLFVLISFSIITNKAFEKLSIYCFSILITLIISAIVFHDGDSNFFMEKNMLPLWLVVGLPVFYLNKNKMPDTFHFFKPVFIIVCFWSVFVLFKTAKGYNNRLNLLSGILYNMQTNHISKGVLSADMFHGYDNITPWTLPYETLILSESKFNESFSIYATRNMAEFKEKEVLGNYFYGADFMPPQNLEIYPFKSRYFYLPKENYRSLDNLVK